MVVHSKAREERFTGGWVCDAIWASGRLRTQVRKDDPQLIASRGLVPLGGSSDGHGERQVLSTGTKKRQYSKDVCEWRGRRIMARVCPTVNMQKGGRGGSRARTRQGSHADGLLGVVT